jgi:hypothetical protein
MMWVGIGTGANAFIAVVSSMWQAIKATHRAFSKEKQDVWADKVYKGVNFWKPLPGPHGLRIQGIRERSIWTGGRVNSLPHIIFYWVHIKYEMLKQQMRDLGSMAQIT